MLCCINELLIAVRASAAAGLGGISVAAMHARGHNGLSNRSRSR